MSKRSGEFITLDELLAEIGVDAARWFFAARGHTSGIDFDIELAKKQSAENPVYYVQYAHARIASILRKAAEAGLAPGDAMGSAAPGGAAGAPESATAPGWAIDAAALAGAPEAALVRVVARFPEVVQDAAVAEETHGITPTPPTSRRSSTPSTATRGSSILPSRNAPRPVSHWCVRRS